MDDWILVKALIVAMAVFYLYIFLAACYGFLDREDEP